MEAGYQKDQVMIRSLDFNPIPHSLERGEGLEMELTIDQAYVKTPEKSQ